MRVEYETTVCPVCAGDSVTKLLPSAKRLSDIGEFRVSDTIFLACCDTCGTMYETPRIKAWSQADYSTRAYYNELNSAWKHDDLQSVWARYNWQAVRDALPWESIKHVVDVGAAGAWANFMLDHVPSVTDSTLVEPSREAIFNAEMRYPALHTVCDIFESWDAENESIDLVSFLNSFYSISDPAIALAKVNRVLRPNGWLIVSFSYAAAELPHWQDGKPWNTLSHLVRGVPQVYYSQRSFRRLLGNCGFGKIRDIVVEIPENDPLGMTGRQLRFVIAQKCEQPEKTANTVPIDRNEIAWAHDYYLTFCRIASQKSVNLFLDRRRPRKITVIGSADTAFNRFVESGIDWHGASPRFLSGFSLAEKDRIDDIDGHWVLIADDRRDLADLQLDFNATQIVHACPPCGYEGYGFSFIGPTGDTIIARSFCPEYRTGDDVFATALQQPDCLIEVPENEKRPPLPAPYLLSEVPELAAQISQIMTGGNNPLRQKLTGVLLPIHCRGPVESSLAMQALGEIPAHHFPVLPDETTATDYFTILTDYRIAQHALVFCTDAELETVTTLLG